MSAISHQSNQIYFLLSVDERRHIFIIADTPMKDNVSPEIASRERETAMIPGTTITFTIIG